MVSKNVKWELALLTIIHERIEFVCFHIMNHDQITFIYDLKNSFREEIICNHLQKFRIFKCEFRINELVNFGVRRC